MCTARSPALKSLPRPRRPVARSPKVARLSRTARWKIQILTFFTNATSEAQDQYLIT